MHGARLLGPGDVEVHAFGTFGWSPLSLQNPDGSTLGKLVSSTTQTHLLLAIGLHERVDFGLDLSVIRNQAGDEVTGFRDTGLSETAVGVGDVRVVPRVLLYSSFGRSSADRGVALSFVGDVRLPTGKQSDFLGDGGFRADPRLTLEGGFGGGHRIFVNGGYTIRPEARVAGTLEVDDYVAFGAGLDLRVIDGLHLAGEVDAGVTPSDVFGSDEVPVEARGALRFPVRSAFLQVGGRGGLSGGATVPDWGILASVGLRFDRDDRRAARARRDALVEAEADDPCDSERPDEERAPGCEVVEENVPAPDRDGDGVADVDDACPDEPGPDVGCPADADGDGVPDESDACPESAEDVDGNEDEDGCPDLDDDGDGFVDGVDRCPLRAGRDGGCPLTLDLTLTFDTSSAALDDAALQALERWASALERALEDSAALEEATLTIVGHADATGYATENQRLSLERAAQVADALRARGWRVEHLVTEGVGSSEPAVPGTDPASLARNRRVEVQLSLSPAAPMQETP